MASRARKLVQGYCKGLLEVRHYPMTNNFQIRNQPDEIFDCLTFTHRTAAEFLQRPEIQSKTRAALVGFDVVDAASQLFLATVRLVRQPRADSTLWARLARTILHLRAIQKKDQAPYDYLTQLESTFNHVLEHQDLRWASWITGIHIKEEKVVVEGQNGKRAYTFCDLVWVLHHSALCGNAGFVLSRLENDPGLSNDYRRSSVLLHCLCYGFLLSPHDSKPGTYQLWLRMIVTSDPTFESFTQAAFPDLVARYAVNVQCIPQDSAKHREMGYIIAFFLKTLRKRSWVLLRIKPEKRKDTASHENSVWVEVSCGIAKGARCKVEILSSPTMKLLLSRNREGASLRELVQL